MNLPNSRYLDVSNAFQHLGSLTDAVAQAFVNPPPPPPRTTSDVMNDFLIASNQLCLDEQRNFVMGISFWTNVLNSLIVDCGASQPCHDWIWQCFTHRAEWQQ